MKRLLTLLATLMLAAPLYAAEYHIDPAHSTVGFKVKHLAISSVSGRFGSFQGAFSFDPAHVSAAATTVSIQMSSVATDEAKRDDHLRSADFFDAEKYPLMTFKSREILDATPERFKVLGDLTLHGVTRPVTLDVVYGGAVKDMYGNERAAFSATATIHRKDFDLTWNKVLETGQFVVGEDVVVSLEIEGVKQ